MFLWNVIVQFLNFLVKIILIVAKIKVNAVKKTEYVVSILATYY